MEDDRQRILRLDQKIMELTQQLKMAESSATNSHEQLNKENHSLQGLLKVKVSQYVAVCSSTCTK